MTSNVLLARYGKRESLVHPPDEDTICSVASLSSQQIVTGGTTGVISIWRLTAEVRGRCDFRLRKWREFNAKLFSNQIRLIKMCEGKIVATAWQESIKVMSYTNNSLVVEEEYPGLGTSRCQAIDVTPEYIAVGGSNSKILVIRRGLDNVRRVYDDPSKTSIRSLLFNDRLLLSSATTPVIKLWDPEQQQPLCTFSEHEELVKHVVWIDSTRFMSCSADGTCKVWSINEPDSIHNLEHTSPCLKFDICRDNNLLAVATNCGLAIWCLAEYELIKELTQFTRITHIKFNPSGDELAIAQADGTTFKLDLALTAATV